MAKRPRIWIVVADGARARFFEPSVDGKKLVPARPADMVMPESRGHERDLKSDRPGRVFSSSRGGVRHALEPSHDYHKLEKHQFLASVAAVLDAAFAEREFDELILVAPRRSLGEFRTLLSGRVQRAVRREIAKELTSRTPAVLWDRLASFASRGRQLA